MITFDGGDWRKLRQQDEAEHSVLREELERAGARLVPHTPYTPEERLKALEAIHFRPHGLYLPDSSDLRDRIQTVLVKVGNIAQVDERLGAYYELQARTELLAQKGVPGHWVGQQAVVRSPARFRLVAWGRRAGKTTEAAAEAVAYAIARPRSTIWLAAPVMEPLVARGFDMIIRRLVDLGIEPERQRDSSQYKLVVLKNGSRIEGVSLDAIPSVAGAAVDFAVVDEAAQIDPQAWYRAIIPPLMDRNGQALLISSYEGQEGFFYDKSKSAEKGVWDIFQGASYEVNFFAFPQGRRTKALVDAESEMPRLEFLEQFGAIPAGVRDRVFPEFRSRVHTGRFGFDKSHPVILLADPSGGGSPYAVMAVQDYGEWFKVIDEFYETYTTTEKVVQEIDRRPWRDNVVEVIVDSASPDEGTRWSTLGYPAIAVWDKPQIWERLPLHRNALRDPGRFRELSRVLTNQILAETGLPPDSDLDMSPQDQYAIELQVEEALSDEKLTPEMIESLRKCARMFIDISCINTIMEHTKYRYLKRRQGWMNLKERPADAYNHQMDNTGYFLWHYKRFTKAFTEGDFSFLAPSGLRIPVLPREDDPDLQPVLADKLTRGSAHLDYLRQRYSPQPDQSFLAMSN